MFLKNAKQKLFGGSSSDVQAAASAVAAAAKLEEARGSVEDGNLNYRVLAFAGGVGLMVTSFLDGVAEVFHLDVSHIFLSMTTFALGFVICILEGKFLPRDLRIVALVRTTTLTHLPFMKILWKRGVVYLLAGLLQCTRLHPLDLLSGLFMSGVGLLFVAIAFDAQRRLATLKRSLQNETTLKREFDKADYNKTGSLSIHEFGLLTDSLGLALNDADELDATFSMVDIDDNGRVSYQEFKQWWLNFDDETDNPQTNAAITA